MLTLKVIEDRDLLFPSGSVIAYQDEEVGGLAFHREPGNREMVSLDSLIIPDPAMRDKGTGTALLKYLRAWLHTEAPQIKYASSDPVNQGSFRLMNRLFGEPLYVAGAIRVYSVDEAMKQLPERGATDETGAVDTRSGHHIDTVHWIGKGRRPKKNPWADAMSEVEV